jgi:hypothetical protein
LDNTRGVARFNQVHGFTDRLHSDRKKSVEVNRSGGIVRIDINLFLQQDWFYVWEVIAPASAFTESPWGKSTTFEWSLWFAAPTG